MCVYMCVCVIERLASLPPWHRGGGVCVRAAHDNRLSSVARPTP